MVVNRNVLFRLIFLTIAIALHSNVLAQTPIWSWVKPMYSNWNETVNEIAIDKSNNDIIVVGNWDGGDLSSFFPTGDRPSTDLSDTYGWYDGFVARFNSVGDLIWAFKIGGPSDDRVYGVNLDSEGNIYVTGHFGTGTANFSGISSSTADSTAHEAQFNTNMYIAKYTPDGSLLWVRYSTGLKNTFSYDIYIVNSDLYITGTTSGKTQFGPFNLDFNFGSNDIFVAKYNLDGQCQWVTKAGSNDQDAGHELVADNSSVYIVGEISGGTLNILDKDENPAGSLTNTENGRPDILVLSFDSNGSFRWARKIGANNNDNSRALDHDQDSIYIAGNISNGAMFPSYADNPVATGSGDNIFICSMGKNNGNAGWVHAINRTGPGNDVANKLALSSTGSIYFTGRFENTITFPGSNVLISDSMEDVFVASFESDGAYKWAINGGGSGDDKGRALAIISDDNIIVGGIYEDPSQFGTINIPSGSFGDMFIASISSPCTDAIGGVLATSASEICQGENTSLTLSSYSGVITWQNSPHGLNSWSNIPVETLSTISISPLDSNDYRAFLSSGTCNPDSSNILTINVNANPFANAGVGGDECDFYFQLQATPSVGIGTWTMTSGTGTASFSPNANDPNALATMSEVGTKEFTWTEVNGTCINVDTVSVNFFEQPLANAGVGGDECDFDLQLQATPSVGTGTWTMTSGTGTASFSPNANDPNAVVTVLEFGTKELTWTEVNGTCNNADTINVIFYEQPLANAGEASDECDFNFQLQATPSVGIGTWTMTSGTGNASFSPNVNDPNAMVTVSEFGTKEFTWIEVNGTCSNSDTVSVNFFEQPLANAGMGGDECDFDLQLQATPSVGIGTWTMTSGTGNASFSPNANDPNVIVTVSEFGTKEFTWTEVNGTCSNSATITVNFFGQPIANAGAGGDECDLDFQLQATPSVGTGTWTMISGTGNASFSPNANDPNAVVTVSEFGTKEFTWTEVNGTCSNAATIIVNLFEQQPANAGVGGVECDLDFQLQAISSVGTGTWTITSGTGAASFSTNVNDPNAVVTVSDYGIKEFTWTEINGTCSNSATISVSFFEQPLANAGLDAEICISDGSYTISGSSSANGIILWTTSGDGSFDNSSADNPTYTIGSEKSTVTLTKTVSGNGSCTDAIDFMILTLVDLSSVNAGASGNVCGLNYELNAISDVGSGYWQKISGPGEASFSPSPTSASAIATVDEFGTYQFQWNQNLGNCSGNDQVTVQFHKLPEANAGPDQVLDFTFTTYLNALTPETGIGQWELVSGSGHIENKNDPATKVSELQVGKNEFTWIINSDVCEDVSGNVIITVNDLMTPTVITPNNDGFNDFLEFSSLDEGIGCEIIIYNRWGTEVYRNSNYQNNWDGRDHKNRELPTDTYYYIIKFSSGKLTKSFVEIRK